ncbi:MAG: DUF4263 domain-containing protein [Verrucomicrobia bacterium]|nr:DUF4263 domain-containing protein [Verrucomicrobiota bacterium]
MAKSLPKIPVPGNLALGLREALTQATTERPVHLWLKKNPLILSAAVEGVAYPNRVVSGFKFGTDYVADFVAVSAFSGAIEVHLVELEPPGVHLFNRQGSAAGRLNGAITQINDWRAFIEKHRDEVLRELVKSVMARDLVWGKTTSEPTDSTGMSFYDPHLWVIWRYHIVIGRRAGISKTQLGKKAAYGTNSEIDVMTYDRLLDRATAFDRCTGKEISIHRRPELMPPTKGF